jgi:uncharacterized protein
MGKVSHNLVYIDFISPLSIVMGMDWHSSGITTSVVGALKRGLGPVEDELGLYVCGGRGRHSRKTPAELLAVGERTGLDGEALGRSSRLVAKVDNSAVQDGFQIYLHSFIVAADGGWTVIQQGMNQERGEARRYHWLSEGITSFVDEPHAAIEGEPGAAAILNLTDHRAAPARDAQVEVANRGPDSVAALWRQARRALPHLQMPRHHDLRQDDVLMRRLHGNLAAAADRGPKDFAELLLTPGVGPRTVEALALVSEVVYGAPARFTDPARFAMAHGGKDGHPFPVPLTVYDQTLRVMRGAVDRGRLGQRDRLEAMKSLDRQARLLERAARGEPLATLIARERRRSHEYGGRTVFGKAKRPVEAPPRPAQLVIPGLG